MPTKLPSPVDAVNHKDKHANIPTEELRGLGHSAFLEIVDPWDAKNTIRAFLKSKVQPEAPIFRITNQGE